jgi:hypothetical protein
VETILPFGQRKLSANAGIEKDKMVAQKAITIFMLPPIDIHNSVGISIRWKDDGHAVMSN